jgi:hypothetical protein
VIFKLSVFSRLTALENAAAFRPGIELIGMHSIGASRKAPKVVRGVAWMTGKNAVALVAGRWRIFNFE